MLVIRITSSKAEKILPFKSLNDKSLFPMSFNTTKQGSLQPPPSHDDLIAIYALFSKAVPVDYGIPRCMIG